MKFHRFMIAVLVLASLLVGLWGCGAAPEETIPDTVTPIQKVDDDDTPADDTPADDTPADDIPVDDAPVVDQPVLRAYDFEPFAAEAGQVPILRVTGGAVKTAYRMIWDVENGTISGEEILLTDLVSKDVYYLIWDGGNLIAGYISRATPAPGAAADIGEWWKSNFGQCYYDRQTGKLNCLRPDGILEIPLPEVPADAYEEAITTPSIYAHVTEDEELILVYQKYIESMTLVYGVIPLDGSSEGTWNYVDVPQEFVNKMDATDLILAWQDGLLYVGMTDDLLVVNLEKGEITQFGLWEKMGSLYQNKVVYTPSVRYRGSQKILGGYGDILLVDGHVFDENGGTYSYTIAIEDGNVIGVMEQDADSPSILYNGAGEAVGQYEAPERTFLKFPKNW